MGFFICFFGERGKRLRYVSIPVLTVQCSLQLAAADTPMSMPMALLLLVLPEGSASASGLACGQSWFATVLPEMAFVGGVYT